MGVKSRLRELMSDNGDTIQSFSVKVGVPKGTFEKYLNSDRMPSPEVLLGISANLGVSIDWLLTGNGPKRRTGTLPKGSDVHDLHGNDAAFSRLGDDELSTYLTLPGYTVEASAGHGAFAGVEARYDVMAVHSDWIAKRGLKADALCLISVKGDSMAPALIDGELIMLDRSQTALHHGAIFVVTYSDALFVKRIQQLPGNRLQLLSSNPDYPPIVIDGSESDQVKVVGRVVASMREW